MAVRLLSRRRIPGDLAPRYQSEQCRPRQARPVAQFSLCPHCAADGSVQLGHRQRPCAPPGCLLQRPGEASPLVASDPRAADRGQGRRSAPAAKTRRSTGVTWSRFTLSTCTFPSRPTADRNPLARTPVRHATRRTRFLRSRAAGSSPRARQLGPLLVAALPMPCRRRQQAALRQLHKDDNNRFNPGGTSWVVRSWLELDNAPGESVFILREDKDDPVTEARIPLHPVIQLVIDTERLYHVVWHPGPRPRYALITSWESDDMLDTWIAAELTAERKLATI